MEFHSAGPFRGNQALQIVAIWPLSPKTLLVEKALDAAAQAHLIRVFLDAYGPAHVLVPATAQYRDCGPREPRGNNP